MPRLPSGAVCTPVNRTRRFDFAMVLRNSLINNKEKSEKREKNNCNDKTGTTGMVLFIFGGKLRV